MASNKENLVRYKRNGEFVYLPKLSKAAQKKARKEYMQKWQKENPEKVKANYRRYEKNLKRNFIDGVA